MREHKLAQAAESLRIQKIVVAAVATASEQTANVEERAITLLHEQGHYAGLTCDEERDLDALVRAALVG